MGIRASIISCAGLVLASGVVVPADEVQAPMSAKTWHFDQPSDYSYISEVISVNEGGNSLAELKRLPSGAFWQAWYKGPSSKHAPEYHTVAVGADRSIVAAGETWDRSGAGNTSELILNKYNQDGQLLAGWPKRYAGRGYRWNEGQDVVVDAGGNIVVAGYTITFTQQWWFAVWRFDSNGNLQPGWPRYPVGNHAYGTGVIVDSKGDIIACGGTGPNAVERMALMKYKPNGSAVAGWPKTYQVHPGQKTFAFDLT